MMQTTFVQVYDELMRRLKSVNDNWNADFKLSIRDEKFHIDGNFKRKKTNYVCFSDPDIFVLSDRFNTFMSGYLTRVSHEVEEEAVKEEVHD